MNRECMKKHFGTKLDKIEEYEVKEGTILYSGVDPAHINISTDPSRYKYFTTVYETAKIFATAKKMEKGKENSFVQKYIVIKPFKIFLQNDPKAGIFYYDTPEGYSSDEAQCLIRDGFHGYATKMESGRIEDIGLGNVSGLVIKVANGGRKRRVTRKSKRALSRKAYRAQSNTAK